VIYYVANLTRFIDTEDVSRALLEVQELVDQKIGREDYLPQLEEQRAVNEVLCAENCLARWFWKSGSLSLDGQTVPWEI